MQPKKLSILALFSTLALIISAVESTLPPLVPIPGIKLGLANIVTLVLLRRFTAKDALLVLTVRILLSSLLFGQAVSLLYSLAGGLLSLFFMNLTNRLLKGGYLGLTSITGGISHNIGQITIALLLTQVPGVLAYLPFLVLSGILTGLFTGLCAHFMLKFLPDRL